MADVIKKEIQDGINLYYIPDTKYKTVSLSVYLNRRLKKDEATSNALLAKILTRGTGKCKNIIELSTYADELYGALYDVNITKKAGVQSIVSTVNFLADEYVGAGIAKECTTLALDLIFDPYTDGEKFPADVVKVEKQNLKDDIEGLINDKRSYANFRCIEEMCKGEENSIFEFGYLEDLPKIDETSAYKHYKDIVTKSTIDIFVVGNIAIDEMCADIKDYFSKFEFDIKTMPVHTEKVKKADEVKFVSDSFDVVQGKLAMGFTTGVCGDDDNYYALLLANSIYGSGAHSRLFNTVREKMSLCYYASSMLDKYRAIMLVSSGIEFENYEKAKSEIQKQLDLIKKGDFTDEEFDVAKSFVINSYRSYKDSPYSMKEYYRSQCFGKNHDSIDEAIEKISKVTKQDIKQALSDICLNTVYFLKGKEQ